MSEREQRQEGTAPVDADDPCFEQEVHLRDYLRVLRNHLVLVTTVVVVVVTLAAIHAFRQSPLYSAAARVLIEKEAPAVIAFNDNVAVQDWDDTFYPTQYQILQSRSLAEGVVRRLRLEENPEFRPAPPEPGAPVLTAQERLDGLVDDFLGRVRIDPVRNTRIVNVGVTAGDPKLAALLANTLADVYIEQTLTHRIDTTRQAGEWLSEQSGDARRRLEESERALQDFNEANDIISLEQRQSLVVQKLEELNGELTRARTARIELETRAQQLAEMRSADADAAQLRSIPQVMSNTLIQSLRADLARLERDLVEHSKVYTAKHPKLIALTAQIRAQRQRIAEEIANVEQGIRQEYQVAQRREQTLAAALEEQKRQVQTLNEHAITHGALKREMETNREIFRAVLEREKETGIAAGVRTSNIRVVDRAVVPRAPVSPRRGRAIALALVLGLVGGVGLAFLVEYFDDSVKDPADLERFAHLPFLGAVPLFRGKAKGTAEGLDLIVQKEPRSVFAEAYRLVRTNLLMSVPDDPPRVIMVTSSEPMEGKTVTAANIAAALALADQRVLLVDADLRRPRLHKVFGLANLTGLSTIVTGSDDLAAVIRRSVVPNLSVMTSGPTPPNSSEMLGSARMGRLLEALRGHFDRVVVDCAPVMPIADATVLAGRVDGVVLVVKAGATSRKVLRHAREMLRGVNARVLGGVLNRADRRKHYYTSPYYYASYVEESPAGKEAPPALAEP